MDHLDVGASKLGQQMRLLVLILVLRRSSCIIMIIFHDSITTIITMNCDVMSNLLHLISMGRTTDITFKLLCFSRIGCSFCNKSSMNCEHMNM